MRPTADEATSFVVAFAAGFGAALAWRTHRRLAALETFFAGHLYAHDKEPAP